MNNVSARVLIIYPVDFHRCRNRGIYNKMLDQGQAFANQGLLPLYAYLKGKECILFDDKKNKCKTYSSGFSKSWTKYFRLFSSIPNTLNLSEFQIVYVRHLLFSTPLFQFLKKAKSNKCKIIYEFPTYPYRKEWLGINGFFAMCIDLLNKRKCLRKVDLVVHYGGFVECQNNSVQITNGIRTDNVTMSKESKSFDKTIHLIGVGKWRYWHGLDRVLEGMRFANHSIHLHLVGSGSGMAKIKRLSQKYSLLSSITFHGDKFDNDLRRLLNKADIGIGTLGLHRKDVMIDSSLKHRLYCMNALPFILSSKDLDFGYHLPFCFQVPTNNIRLDIDAIVERFKKLRRNLSEKVVKQS